MKAIIYALFLALPILAIGQEKGKVAGQITDNEGLPAAFVSVVVKGSTLGAASDANGKFIIPNVPAGPQALLISAIGFTTVEQAIQVNANATTNVEIELLQSSKELGAVEVLGQRRVTSTATKSDIAIMDIPMAIQVIGQDVIQQQAIIDMRDVVRNVSSVTQTGSYNGGYQYFNSRGFDMNNWTNFRRNGTLLWNMGNHYADFYERIEFLKGPAAILYGDVAPGGIMNFVTKKPLAYDYRRFELKVGQYGLVRPSFDISGPLNAKKNVLYRINTTYEKSNSFRDVVENETLMLATALQWKITDRTSLLVEGTLKDDERIGDPGVVSPDGTFEGLKRISEKTFLGEREATYSYNNKSLFSTLRHDFNEQWSLQHLVSFTTTERTPRNVYINNDADENGNITRYQYFFKQRFNTVTTSLDITGVLTTGSIKHKILAGADFVDDDIRMGGFNQEDIAGTINLFAPRYGQARLTSLSVDWSNTRNFTTRVGVYVQDQMSFFEDKLHVLVGLRYNSYVSGNRFMSGAEKPEDYQEVKEKPLVPRAGVVYKPLPWMSLYTSYAESYEVNGFDWINANYAVPPTKGKQAEIGIKGDFFDERLGLTLAAFDIVKNDAYSWAYSDEAPAFEHIAFNAEEAYYTYLAPEQRSRGIELDFNGRLTNNLKLTGAASYIVAEVVKDPAVPKGNWLANQPRYMGNIWASYSLPFLQSVDISYGLFYRGAFFADVSNAPESKAKSNYTMDAAIGYNYKSFRMQLNVSNMTNRVYYLGSFGTWEPQWTRRAVLTLAYKF